MVTEDFSGKEKGLHNLCHSNIVLYSQYLFQSQQTNEQMNSC